MERGTHDAQDRKAFFQQRFRGNFSRTAGAASVGSFLKSMAQINTAGTTSESQDDDAINHNDSHAATSRKTRFS